MRQIPFFLFVLLTCAHAGAAPAPGERPVRSQAAKADIRRAAPLPPWAQALAEIPRTERSDAVVLRLDETQALAGEQPAILVNRAIQVNDRSALAAIGQVSLSYYAAYQALSLHRVAILRDGKVLDRTASVEARILQRETAIEQGMVGGASTIQLLLEDVRVGDTLWLTYSVAGANPVFEKKWFDEFAWDRWTPVELRRLTVLYPRQRKPAWRQLGDFRQEQIVPRIGSAGQYELMVFEGRNLDPLDDEPSVASDYLPARTLQFSEFADWASVARWASALFPPSAASPVLKAQADQFRKHATPAARAAAALHWVQDEIRYFSVSIGENSHRPQAPATVLKRRYGDCKDKSYLLIALLGELGIQARPVLLSASAPRLPARVGPSPGWFDHVIVEVQIDGKNFYVDPTRLGQQAPIDKLSAAFPGASSLVVDPATTALIVLPEQDRPGPAYELVETIAVSDYSGDASMETREIFRAELAEVSRQRYAALSPLELKKAALRDYEKRYPGIAMLDAPLITDDRQANQLELRARFRMPKAVKLVDGAQSIDYQVPTLEGVMVLPDKLVRSFPLAMPAAQFHSRYRLNITWPDDVRAVETPWSRFIDNQFFQAHEAYLFRGNQLNHMVDYRTKARTVQPADVPELHKEAKRLDELGYGRFSVGQQYKIGKEAAGFSARDIDLVRTAALADELALEIGKAQGAALDRDKACLLLQLAGAAEGLLQPASQKVLALARRRIEDDGADPGARACRARMAFDAGDFAGSVRMYRQISGQLKDQPKELRTLAWAQLSDGQAEAAVATIQQYADQREKDDKRSGADLELIDRIALLQRSGRALPPDMLERARRSPDGPWPRPLLAMQAGLLGEEELIRLADAMPEHLRAYALTEALFYVGQRRLAAQDMAGAEAAFRRLQEVGIRSSDLYQQGRAELGLLTKARKKMAAVSGKGDAFVRQVREGAAAGDPSAQFLLGAIYQHGEGLGADPAQAAHWYRKAIEGGDPRAPLGLSELYRLGQGVPKDEHAALALMRSSAELGYPAAMALVGWRYYQGFGYAKDPVYAALWFKRAALHGDPNGGYGLGLALYQGQGVERHLGMAAAMYLGAAKQGHELAQLDLGYMYEMGEGVAKDMREAAAWYRKSAEQGNPIAQKNLGQLYEDGNGVGADEQLALSWYRKSAAQGNARAMMKIGYLLEFGRGGKKDSVEAHGWNLKAAELDDALAQYNLAQQFRQGRGVAANPAEAVKWFKRAAKQGDLDAMVLLGDTFLNGEGVPKDPDEALRWFTAAAEGGDASANLKLGIMYLNGTGVARDRERAYKLFEQAGAAGQDAAYYWLGLMHENGMGRAKDDSKALALYIRAEKLWDANIRRAVLSASGRGGPRDPSYFRLTLSLMMLKGEVTWMDKLAQAFDAVLDGERVQQVYEAMLPLAEKSHKPELVRAVLGSLADSYLKYMLPAKAEAPYLRLLALREAAHGKQHSEVADTLDSLASVYLQTARLDLAESMAKRALEIRRTTLGEGSAETRRLQRQLAAVVGARGDLAGARQYLGAQQAWLEQHMRPADTDLPDELARIAQKYYDLGQYAEAEALYRRALAIIDAKDDADARLDFPLNGLAWTLSARGAHAESERLFRRAAALLEKRHGKGHHMYAATLGGLGLQLSKQDRHGEAEQTLREAFALREVYLGRFDAEVALALNQSGMAWARQGKTAEAEAAFRKSLALREKVFVPVHAEIAESLDELGALYLARQEFDKAGPLLQRALAIRRQLMPAHPDTRRSEALVDEWQRKTRRL